MNITINRSAPRRSFLFGTLMVTTLVIVSFFLTRSAYAAINSYLQVGSTGEDVSELQTYLSTNADIYPSGLVTGYFGPLTEAAVQRFQSAQGIVSSGSVETTGYGRVGPQTMARINSLMGSPSVGPTVSWDPSPSLSTSAVQVTSNSATLTWTSNEITQGQLYYDTVPIRADEATGPRQQPYVSGVLAVDNFGLQTSHTVTIQNLRADTLYYYIIRGVDVGGNMSMTRVSSFRTNQ